MMLKSPHLINRRKVLISATAAATGLLSSCRNDVSENTAAATTKPMSSKPSDVIIIGAGLSGLNAALLLEEMGYSVTVVEGRDRVGGRVFTMDDVPGYPEAGASGIGSSYGRLIGLTERLGVPLVGKRDYPSPYSSSDTAILNIDGQMIKFEDWPTHPLNPLPADYKSKLPFRIAFSEYAKDNPLKAVEDFIDPQWAKFDYSIYKYFSEKGFDDEAINLMLNTNQSYGDASGAHGISLLMMFNVLANAMNGPTNPLPGSPFCAKGGMMRIPEAMANNLKTDIRLNTRVVGIRNEESHAEVHLSNNEVLKAKRVIVTTPFSALRLIDLDIPTTPNQDLAIRTLGYTNITHVSFEPTRAYWEEDGLPPSLWTDGPVGRMAANFDTPEDRESVKIASFMAAAGGAMSEHLDRLGAEGATQFMLDYLAKIRPSTKGALKFVKFWSWQLDPFAGGSYAAWKPGQISTFGADMAKPAGRIHFAGEHTCQVTRGMEAAMESGERAAFEVEAVL